MHTNKQPSASAGSYTPSNIVLVPKSDSISGLMGGGGCESETGKQQYGFEYTVDEGRDSDADKRNKSGVHLTKLFL